MMNRTVAVLAIAELVVVLAACAPQPDAGTTASEDTTSIAGSATDGTTGVDASTGGSVTDGVDATTGAGPDTSGETSGTDTSGGDSELTPEEEAALEDEMPRPQSVDEVSSAMGHFHVARQASTYFAGPQNNEVTVELIDLEDETGIAVGTSPWHVFSTERYDEDGLTTVWGTGLTHAYKARMQDGAFEILSTFEINTIASSIPWNLVAFDDGRVLIPDQDGWRAGPKDHPCAGDQPAFLVLRDDLENSGDPAAPILCEKKFEFVASELRDRCGAPVGSFFVRSLSGISTAPLFGGGVATTVTFDLGGDREYYMAVIDETLSELRACAFIDDSAATNEFPVEQLDRSTSAMYVPTGDAIVKMVYDAQAETLEKRWERTVPVRERTGTTPTLVDTPSGDNFVVTIDAQCATSNVLNGLIVCSDDRSPSRLVAVRRDDELMGAVDVLTTDLPATIQTVENSPSARRGMVVVANYSGYLPNGLLVPAGGTPPEEGAAVWGTSPDSVADFGAGMVALQYDGAAFNVIWEVDEQVSGVPTISGGANLVYGTGAEQASGMTYLYAFILEDDERGDGGSQVMRVELGVAPFRETTTNMDGHVLIPISEYGLNEGEFYDAGNNLMLHSDRSLVITGGRSLARVSSN